MKSERQHRSPYGALTWHGTAQDLGPHADGAPPVPGAGVDPEVAPHHRGREDVPHGDLLLPVASEDLLRQTPCWTLTSPLLTLQYSFTLCLN
jgi:hypothetical protein